MGPKKKRIVDIGAIRRVKANPCIVCGYLKVDAHHIRSKGAGGHDTDHNLVPLCRTCHRSVHDKGLRWMIEHSASLKYALEQKGWDLSDLTHPLDHKR